MAINKARGYTLIELVVVVGLVGMLSIGMISIFLASLRSSAKAQIEAEVKSQGDYAVALIERSLRNAISAPTCPAGRINYQVYVGNTPTSKSFVYDSVNKTITDGTNSLFGNNTNLQVTNVAFTCPTTTFKGVIISFRVTANGKMNQSVNQTFKSTIAIRSVQ